MLKNIKQIKAKPTINGWAMIATDVDNKTFDCFIPNTPELVFNNEWKNAALVGQSLKAQYNCPVTIRLSRKHFPRNISFK